MYKPKGIYFNQNKSKIDWNLKYAFPKSTLFDYSIKSSKIDLLNKNLEKKIT